jgi:hypothetical protein
VATSHRPGRQDQAGQDQPGQGAGHASHAALDGAGPVKPLVEHEDHSGDSPVNVRQAQECREKTGGQCRAADPGYYR